MKNNILIFIFVLSCNFSKAQQYFQNIPIDSVLNSGHYFYNGCTQALQTHIRLDTSLYNYVNSLQFMVIIDSANVLPYNEVSAGDTIFLSAMNPDFHTVSPNQNFWYRIKLSGTPIIANQSYPCKIELDQCTCFCLDILIRASYSDTSTCIVDIANSINEIDNNNNRVNIYPNPAINTLSISGIVRKTNICLYNALGEFIIEREIDDNITIDTSQLTEGIYMLFIKDESKSTTFNKVVIAK